MGKNDLIKLTRFFGYLYMLRVPLLAWLFLLFVSEFGKPAGAILPGVFDVSQASSPWRTVLQFAIVTMASLLAAAAIAVTARLVVWNASTRFNLAQVRVSSGIELLFRIVPLLGAFSVWSGAFHVSSAEPVWMLLGTLIGIVAFLFAVGFVQDWLWDRCVLCHGSLAYSKIFAGLLWLGTLMAIVFATKNRASWGWGTALFAAPMTIFAFWGRRSIGWFRSGSWIPGDRKGYMFNHVLQDKHVFALLQFAISIWTYALYFTLKYLALGQETIVPTLSLVLLVVMLICWTFAALAFFFDMYRVPLLLIVIGYASAVGVFRQGDHYFRSYPHVEPYRSLSPGDVLLQKPGPVVLVAATGGGIQAAAWTTRVLAGLAGSAQQQNFDQHLRLISSVSGGSVGALMFLADYDNGKLRDHGEADSHPAVRAAERSSLDELTWGLAYPDLIFGLFPFAKGISYDWRKNHFYWANGWQITTDRGSALEDTWRFRMDGGLKDTMLSDWRAKTEASQMPAVIFNSTVVETGKRFLLSTADFRDDCDQPTHSTLELVGDSAKTGRAEFFDFYCGSDIRASTAARLSATFPFVSPASRIFRAEYGGINDVQQHVVDGGYYDNYGMVTLVEWLDAALVALKGQPLPPILIIEIRSSSTEGDDNNGSDQGWAFQTIHPLLTLWNVRGTSQLAHNVFDYGLLKRGHPDVYIDHVVFEFNHLDNRGEHRTDPLNWHLTPDDIQALRDEWNDPKHAGCRAKVRDFLAGRSNLPECNK